MFNVIKITFALLVCTFFSITTLSSVQAASQATMEIKADIVSAKFWDYNFINDSTISKPSTVKLIWSVGNIGNNQKEETIIEAGKMSGQSTVVSTRGEAINLTIVIRNSKNENIGSWSMQIPNKGQNENITISLPESVKAEITRNDK